MVRTQDFMAFGELVAETLAAARFKRDDTFAARFAAVQGQTSACAAIVAPIARRGVLRPR